jgi:hypothetical protein
MTDTLPAKSDGADPAKKDGESTVQDYIGTGSAPTKEPVDPNHK